MRGRTGGRTSILPATDHHLSPTAPVPPSCRHVHPMRRSLKSQIATPNLTLDRGSTSEVVATQLQWLPTHLATVPPVWSSVAGGARSA